jgi:hypothetical protein
MIDISTQVVPSAAVVVIHLSQMKKEPQFWKADLHINGKAIRFE